MIKTKEEKLILIISSIVAVILSIVVLILGVVFKEIKWTWCFSILIGQAVSIACFFKSSAIINTVLDGEQSHAKFLFILNNVLGTFVYAICLLLNFIIPGLNIIINAIGILIIKFVTFIVGTFSKSEVK